MPHIENVAVALDIENAAATAVLDRSFLHEEAIHQNLTF